MAINTNQGKRHLVAGLAKTPHEIREAQKLRYQVFVQEMGAMLHAREPGLDQDAYDEHCEHLIVRDMASGAVVGYTRILDEDRARRAGGFYSHGEFELGNVLRLPGRFMEIGRTCVHPDYRTGATIAVLWSALARHISEGDFDYVMGCASIQMRDRGALAQAIMERLRDQYMVERDRRVLPRLPLPVAAHTATEVRLPPLLKAYLSLGARVCGEPCWDPAFQVADLFVLFDLKALNERYARRFLIPQRSGPRRKVA
ncbi:GNAT family N-acetyltransferase [Alkalilimnicola sp. S0819]|uniref:GNAT family N-acetyltransferase n=1 Tax=Alkalilimnicola sp. S0819 TaxID=2613922 RepID=UPI001262256D|nr:GNAT family N-acyltransferase [Alkalilimnicola sp. S0819]KAB7622596.1 GNAT family N-acetyltransferase [Alkalilimnicola sp. S0819]MPQ17486.1 GNAT family N-acetyltransferase [Alkalilimnicola sp. S0819]